MGTAPAGSLPACLWQIPDPRGAQRRRHSCQAMLAAIVCAVMSGARGFEAIAPWIHAQLPEVWYLRGYYRRPPTGGAFRYLRLRLDSEILQAALREWIAGQFGQTLADQEVALDGKTLCGTLTEHGRSIQLLSLFDQQICCVLSQIQVPASTNEAKASLEILKTLTLRGRVVTADAMFCEKPICEAILAAGGGYLIVVKDNQRTLKKAIVGDILPAFPPATQRAKRSQSSSAQTSFKEHGRLMKRRLEASGRSCRSWIDRASRRSAA